MQVQNYISKAVFNVFDFLLREISIKIAAIVTGEILEIEKSKLTESEKKHCKTVARKIQEAIDKEFKTITYNFNSRFNSYPVND